MPYVAKDIGVDVMMTCPGSIYDNGLAWFLVLTMTSVWGWLVGCPWDSLGLVYRTNSTNLELDSQSVLGSHCDSNHGCVVMNICDSR